jgi:hypothetical protein
VDNFYLFGLLALAGLPMLLLLQKVKRPAVKAPDVH